MANIPPADAGWGAYGSFANYANDQLDASLTWKDVEWLRGITSLPLILKGILRPEDAAIAVESGVAAVWVSNHGGRQLDSEQATILALPAIVETVAGRSEIYIDGGFRRGTDVLKALALGARAAFIGRPYLWGLAAGGEEGVSRVLALLRNELEVAMAVSGVADVADVDRGLVVPG
jgi:isopentenyl diphosphate isomerase/L-lactate dehydrogenase-like FMN-dependent dehydrogenase